MALTRKTSEARRRLNLSIREDLIAEARKEQVNLSRFLEEKLEQALREVRGRQWLDENREALAAFDARVARDGPLNGDLLPF